MKGTPFRLFILFVCTAGSLLILQNAFDVSDHKKALRGVQGYRAEGSATPFEGFLEARAPGGAWDWESPTAVAGWCASPMRRHARCTPSTTTFRATRSTPPTRAAPRCSKPSA